MARKKTSRSAPKRRRPASARPKSVRQRVHDLTLRAVRDNDLSVRDIPDLARKLVQSAAEGLDNSISRSQRSVLRQVIGGLTDAAAAAAHAASTTARSAARRGKHFLSTDAKHTAKDLKNLERQMLDSIGRAGKSMSTAARAELDAAVLEARHAGTKIRAATGSARTAADGRLDELGRETTQAGARAARRAIGSILQGAGGLLEGLADAVTTPAPGSSPRTRKTPARAGRAKTARRRA